MALYTLKPNVAVSISGRLNTCRVLNFQVQAVSCTVSLMQGCNHTATVRHTPIRKEWEIPSLWRGLKVILFFLALTLI